MVEVRYFRLPQEAKERSALAIYDSKPVETDRREGKLGAFLTAPDIRQPTFILTKGLFSPYYVDLRVVPAFPKHFGTLITQLAWYIDTTIGAENIDFIISTESAGIPFGAAVAHELRVEYGFNFARKEPKQVGTKKFAEGYIRSNSNGVDVDDMLTTTGSLQNAIDGARAEKGNVLAAYVPFNRRQYSPVEIEQNLGVPVLELVNIFEFAEIGERKNRLTHETADQIRLYHTNQAAYALSVIKSNHDFVRNNLKKDTTLAAYEKMQADAKDEKAKVDAKLVVDALKNL